MRVLLVIHRFGREIIGGAERLAFEYARRLAPRHEVTIATTCARDYRTWKNSFAPGLAEEEGADGARFAVRRFPVARRRHRLIFGLLSRFAFRSPDDAALARRWMRAQGPDAPGLVAWVAAEARAFDAVLLFNYLYYPTYQCLPHSADRALLVPLTHDEPPLRIEEYRSVFMRPRGILVSSKTEEALIRARWGESDLPPMHYGGSGVTCDDEAAPASAAATGQDTLDDSPWLKKQNRDLRNAVASGRYFLCAGRIAEPKDSPLLASVFARIMEDRDLHAPLLLVGPLEMPRAALGFHRDVAVADSPAPERELRRLQRGALATLHASRHESLNLAAIESLAVGTPLLVHEQSQATLEILEESGCGARWSTRADLAPHVARLLDQTAEERRATADRAIAFARTRYDWGAVIARVERALEAVAG